MPIEIEGLAALSEILTTQTAAAAKRYLSKAGEAAAQVISVLGSSVDVVYDGSSDWQIL